jgi:hypothetical protein
MRSLLLAVPLAIGLACLSLFAIPGTRSVASSSHVAPAVSNPAAGGLAVAPGTLFPACFEPNLGQWDHLAKFLHRQGSLRMFLSSRGFVLDFRSPGDHAAHRGSGVAVRMTFVDANEASLVGEHVLPGYSNYFLGDDKSRWRANVPRYAAVLCRGIYSGVDVRVRSAESHPEYDILLEPWADLSRVQVDVEGVEGLRIATDGGLVMDTARGSIHQPAPRTWQVSAVGARRELACEYRLLGPYRFGFVVKGWDGDAHLTIDPGLIWSTFLGGNAVDATDAVSVATDGTITVAGLAFSADWPTTIGAYDRTGNGGSDAVVFQLGPSGKNLLNSTFLGGSGNDAAYAMHVDERGTVTFVGDTTSANYPTTAGAYSSTNQGNGDIFVARLDLRRVGPEQLVFSSLIGGGSKDVGLGVFANSEGVVTLAGTTESPKYPVTSRAFDRTHNGIDDVVITRLDPRLSGAKQLVYSTLLGGGGEDKARAMSVDPRGVVTVTGSTASADFPTTARAYDTTHAGGHDVFLTRVDPTSFGDLQLIYSTLLGGVGDDRAVSMHVNRHGVATLGGYTSSSRYPTTTGAYDTTHNGATDGFVSRVDVRQVDQLIWSTLIGGKKNEHVAALGVDPDGVVTIGGACDFSDFPTTPDAYDKIWGGKNDSIVARFDPRKRGKAQLVYSTYAGGVEDDEIHAIAITPSGTTVTAGHTRSRAYPASVGAFDTTFNGVQDVFVTMMDMNVQFHGDVHSISLETGGTQNLQLNAPIRFRGLQYLILGSATGTAPGIALGAVHIPLNWDSYTRTTMGLISPVFGRFRGRLDHNGRESAVFRVPPFLTSEIDLTLNHAILVLDSRNNIVMASNPVPCRLR